MAFNLRHFNNVTSGKAAGPRMWAYNSTTDTLATIIADDYFADVGRSLTANDQIYCLGTDGYGTFQVLSASATSVVLGSSVGSASTRTTIATAAVLLLATTPAELVAAPGAGKILLFDTAHFQLDYATTQYTESADNLVVKYTSAAGVAVSTVVECTGFIDQAADTSTRALAVLDAIVANSANENAALVLDNNNANFAAGDSPLIVDTYYRVLAGV